MSAVKYWLWLSAAPELGAPAKAELLRAYGDAEAVYAAPEGEATRLGLVKASEEEALRRHELKNAALLEKECEHQGLKLVTFADAAYPRRLKTIWAPPAVLYVKGELPPIDETAVVAVIGTRKASPYGLKLGAQLAAGIVRCGGTVLSGLTEGIDAAAARGALEEGTACIGVLGTAHERAYGPLAEELQRRGVLVSEYPPGMPTYRSHFRERNRISAGLSAGVVVVEAPEKSGALLFAAEANEQGREIFAVPGNVDAANSAGTFALLREGAKPVRTAWDVMVEFERAYPAVHRAAEKEPAPEPDLQEPNVSVQTPSVDKKPVDKPQGRDYIDLQEQLAGLSEDQLKIVSAIDRGGSHIDDIIEATGLSTARVLSQLTVLEIRGYVRREAGRRITLKITKK